MPLKAENIVCYSEPTVLQRFVDSILRQVDPDIQIMLNDLDHLQLLFRAARSKSKGRESLLMVKSEYVKLFLRNGMRKGISALVFTENWTLQLFNTEY